MKVNIIGAGISGLTAGCYLQMNGYQTEIFEKHSIPGGLCTSWKKGEFTIDGCVHWILGSDKGSSFYKMWSELLDMSSIPFKNHEERLELEVERTRNKYGSNIFHLYTDLTRLEAYLIDLAPEDTVAIKSFIRPMRIMQKFDLPPVMDDLPLFPSIIRGIGMTRYLEFLYWFLKLKKQTNFTFAEKLKNPFLKESFQLLYDGEEVNMMVLTMPLSAFDKKSAGYPIGGSLSFAKRLEQRFLELGGKIHYKTPVKKILIENNTVTGILVRNDVVHKSDITISAADWYFTVFEALEGKYVDQKILDLKDLKKLELFYSVMQFSFGLTGDFKDAPHFSRFPLEEDLVSPDGTIYKRLEVHIYNYDPTLAPAGKTVVTVSFYTTRRDFWINLRKEDRPRYRQAKAEFQDCIIVLLDKRLGGIRERIEMMDVATPATFQRYTNNWKGSTQGWLPGKNLLAPTPVSHELPGLKNFYNSSHWNQPGGGLPIAISTGRSIAKLICRKDRKRFVTIKEWRQQ
jgi:phytoene dehydrogenase-like protein